MTIDSADKASPAGGTADPASSPRWDRTFVLALISLSFSVMLAMGTQYYSFSLFVLDWARDFGVSRGVVALAPLATTIGGMVIAPFTGWLLDRWPGRRIILVGHALLIGGCLMIAATRHWWQVLLVNVVFMGPALHLCGLLAAHTLAGRWAASRPGAAMTLIALGSSLGGFAVPPLVAVILVTIGWRMTFVTIAGFLLLVAVPVIVALLSAASRREHASPVRRSHEAGLRWIVDIVSRGDFWIISLSMFALSAGYSGVQHSLAPFAHERGITLETASLLVSLLSVAMVVGKAFWLAIIDRTSSVFYFAVMGCTMIAGFLMLRHSSSTSGICIALVVLGLGGGGTSSYIPMAAMRAFGIERLGRAMSLVMLPISMSAIGAPMAGALFDSTGNYNTAFDLFAILAAGSVVAVVLFAVLAHRQAYSRQIGSL